MTDSSATGEDAGGASDDVRERIVEAAAALIAAGGRDAATTRAVSAAAAVQAPTIYRLFGDKRGLLSAVAERGLADYIAQKAARIPHPDPVQDLRNGWDMHVEFGLAHPGLFAIMSGEADARERWPSLAVGEKLLRRMITSIALAGRLRSSESRAMFLIQSSCTGTVLAMLNLPAPERDAQLSVTAREAVIAAITGDATTGVGDGARGAAVALRAVLHELSSLTPGEQHLLGELLERVADGDSRHMS